MEYERSILDRVLENKQAEDLHQFDPDAVMSVLFEYLNEREREVLTRRFGLGGNAPQTLEVIGKHFGVTRERVRQIETGSVKKLAQLEVSGEQLKPVHGVVSQLLQTHGGVLEENHLLDLALAERANRAISRAIVVFLIEKLLSDHFDLIQQPDQYHRSWKMNTTDSQEINSLVERLEAIVDEQGEPMEEDALVEKALERLDTSVDENRVRGHLRLSKRLKQNIFGHWGKSDWHSISPKRMNDKIYLVLQHVQKPMHFTEIADKINELKFDHKTAYPATVHNELILDDKYVLVGRGIYALADWGYQPGVVADVIARVLNKAEKPLSRDEIVQQVLDQRIVGKSTIHLALMNKQRFSKDADGNYSPAA